MTDLCDSSGYDVTDSSGYDVTDPSCLRCDIWFITNESSHQRQQCTRYTFNNYIARTLVGRSTFETGNKILTPHRLTVFRAGLHHFRGVTLTHVSKFEPVGASVLCG